MLISSLQGVSSYSVASTSSKSKLNIALTAFFIQSTDLSMDRAFLWLDILLNSKEK